MSSAESFPPTDAVGLTVVVCDGGRCRAVRDRTVVAGESTTLLAALRDGVRSSRGSVLVRSACLGVCHRGPAVLVFARHDEPSRPPSAGRLFGPVERAEEVDHLLGLLRDTGRPPTRS